MYAVCKNYPSNLGLLGLEASISMFVYYFHLEQIHMLFVFHQINVDQHILHATIYSLFQATTQYIIMTECSDIKY